MVTCGAAVVISGQGAVLMHSEQTGHGVVSGHWIEFVDIVSGHIVVFSIVTLEQTGQLFSIVVLGQTGQVDSTPERAVVSSMLLITSGAHVTPDGTSRV